MLKAGIVGLPNVGKSTLFNAVTRSRKAEAANYPFCTIDPNVGIVVVPDPRLAVLSKISGSHKLVPTAIEFVDMLDTALRDGSYVPDFWISYTGKTVEQLWQDYVADPAI